MTAEKRQPTKWYRTKWAKRVGLLLLGAAIGASCAQLPEIVQPACHAIVKTLHMLGVP